MGSLLTIVCVVAAAALVAADLVLAFRKPSPPAPQTDADVSGLAAAQAVTDGIKSLAEKSPRLAAALTFMILAGVFSGQISLEASATPDSASESNS